MFDRYPPSHRGVVGPLRVFFLTLSMSGMVGCDSAKDGNNGNNGSDGAAGRAGDDGSAGAAGADGAPASEVDSDGDGISVVDDCDDNDPSLGLREIRYLDYDGDGFGTSTVVQEVCEDLAGWVLDDTDCDDLDEAVFPGGIEVCNDGVDDDCDGLIDDEDDSLDTSTGVIFYSDVDGDGFGDAEVQACSALEGLSAAGGDCNDSDDTIHPDAEEICADGIDQNCNGGPDQCAFAEELSTDDADVYLRGTSTYDYLGESIAIADVNGDGFDDILGGASHTDDNGSNSGGVFALLGSATIDELDIEDATPLFGPSSSALAGYATAGLGDLDGDGFEDVAVGAYGVDSVYVVYGGTSAWSASGDLEDHSAVVTPVNDVWYFGREVRGAGDVDGDGLDDLLIGDEGASANAGTVYLVLGSTTAMSGSVYIEDILHAEWTADTEGDDFAERGSTGVGDFDGDGLSDIVLGEPSNDDAGSSYGEATLYLGGSAVSGEVDLADADVTFAPSDAPDSQYLGYCASGIGDHDGDGVEDLALCGRYADVDATSKAGAVYIYLGNTGGWSSELGVGDADGTYLGTDANQYLGSSVAGVGDIDGDGSSELLASASDYDGDTSNTGGVFLFYGESGVSGATYTLDDAAVTVTGTAFGARVGTSLAVGDVNGDGYADLLAGSFGVSSYRGSVYAWFGTGF